MPDSPSRSELIRFAQEADRTSPDRPLRAFVDKLVTGIHSMAGEIHGESWYRKLIAEAGVMRRPSTRTVNACVQRLRERVGADPGPTAITVRELKRQFSGLAQTVSRLEGLVAQMVAAVDRQRKISEALDRRQLLIADQAGGQARDLQQLAGTVRELVADGQRVHKAALEVSLDTARALRAIAERNPDR